MSKKKKVLQEERRLPCGDPAFVKEMRDMMEKGDIDCAQIMSRMMAMCCGATTKRGQPSQSLEEQQKTKTSRGQPS